ncbi:MAG TPA: thioesterase domain-containing protein, partial [Myxococcota bacterium]|nr:thioesterase domain-containing protein [Myxococcota bacterium]
LVRDMGTLVSAIVEAMESLLDKPYALFGFSMGSLVAFEVARALRRRGKRPPQHLFVSARFAPDAPLPVPDPLHLLGDTRFVEEMGRVYGLPDHMSHDADLLRLIVPMMKADMELLEKYRYAAEPPLSCPISAFVGDRDPSVPGEGIERWRTHTTASFSAERLAGPHHFLDRHTDAMVRSIRAALR